jgi:class 3 adenylate cyclase/tetratricopeptide (TPR) repeat protein
MICPTCGFANAEGAKFCSECGAPLATAAPAREERKVVTVLFADLVGFTSRAERLDPEEVRALLQPYHARLRELLERHGGTVEKFIGDAVMAIFGAPVAHEDDPERAVRAALAIRDGLVEEGRLQVRIGVTTGEALVALGARPEAGEGMAAGDVVNTAARLQSAAPVDGVIVDEMTFRATERAIEYRGHDPIAAKGKVEPVPVWEAVQARARFGTDVRQIGGAPLVGRENELEALANALDRARGGEPQLVTLVGVPGIGKSRLVWELFRRVDELPDFVTWRQGRSLPYGEGVSFWALGEMAKAQAGILETDAPEAVEEKLRATVAALAADVPERTWIEGHVRPLVGLGGEAELGGDRRAEAFAAWRRFFEALAEQGPAVLVFEDLHWADEGVLDFVDHLVDWATGVPLLVVGTARPELLSRRPGWGGGKPNAQTVSLAPLSDEDTARLVHSLLERAVVAAEVQTSLLERAGGNPLYAEEFVRLVQQERAGVALPESVQGIIAARLDAVSNDEKALLQDAAVLGKVFWLGGLGGERRRNEELLHALERREFVRRERRSSVAGEAEYAFRHALVREVAYEQIPRAERAERHRRAARWVESLGRPDDHAEMLAHHYVAALEHAKDRSRLAKSAQRALRAAGDRAFALSASPQAARFYEQALDLTESRDAELLFRYGQALHLAADERADPVLVEAAELLLSAGDRERAAEAHAILAEFWWHRGRRDRSLPHVEQATELVAETPASPAKARVLAEVSRHRVLAGAAEEALPLARQAYEMAEELGLTELAARALNNMGIARSDLGEGLAGRRDLERSVELALSVNSPEAARAYNNLGSVVWNAEGPRKATDFFLEALRVGERLGNALVVRFTSGVLPWLLWLRGDWDEALRGAEAFIAECEAGSPTYQESGVRAVRAEIVHARGERDELVLAEVARGLEAARAAGDPQALLPTLTTAIRILVEDGRIDEARGLVAEVRRSDVGAHGHDVAELVVVASELGEEELLREALAQVPEHDDWTRVLEAALAGDWARAADLLGATDRLPIEARFRLRAGRELVAQGRRAEADEQLDKAAAFWRSVGATRYLTEVEALRAGEATA